MRKRAAGVNTSKKRVRSVIRPLNPSRPLQQMILPIYGRLPILANDPNLIAAALVLTTGTRLLTPTSAANGFGSSAPPPKQSPRQAAPENPPACHGLCFPPPTE